MEGKACARRGETSDVATLCDGETEEGRAERNGGSLKGWKGAPHPLSEKYGSINKLPLSSIK